MTPTLARRGKLVLASGSVFALVGALYAASPLVALGGLVLASVMTAYVWFYPTAILLRRRKIEMSWWVPPGDQPGGSLAAERPFPVLVALRNHGARPLRVLDITLIGSPSLALPRGLEAVAPAGHHVEVRGEARAHAPGYHVLHGAVLVFGDVLGLFDVRAYFPNPIAIKVFPRQIGARAGMALGPSAGAQADKTGMHVTRRRGLAGELREIRDHAHGDPFRFIAWKATARRRRLMVRDMETEIVATHQILVDIAGSMRAGRVGRTKLDFAIEAAAGLARAAHGGGDRSGLITFDTRVYSRLRPGSGPHHYLKLLDRLIETHHVVDEDLTDLTPGELVAAVARYLSHQEAVDVRVRRSPPIDDPAWNKIQAGPSGALYDLELAHRVVSTLLETMGKSRTGRASPPAWWWSHVNLHPGSDPRLAALRLFCRLRGIELPYRHATEPGARARGLADAVHRAAAASRPDVLVVVSDLDGLLEDPDQAVKALARARRGGQKVVAVAPFAPAFADAPETDIGRRVADVFRDDERVRLGEARRLLGVHGIPVLEAGPEAGAAALLHRLSRSRAA